MQPRITPRDSTPLRGTRLRSTLLTLRRITRHEIRDVWRDGRFRWAAAFVGGLLGVALVTGWTYQRAVSAEHASAERLSRQHWLSQAAKDPHSAAHYGAYAFKPSGPLTLFDSGVNQYSGLAAWLEAHKQNEFQFRPAQDRTALARLGQLTAASTLQLLIPLLIILLAFTKFAGEREDGTLRQLAAAGVPVRTLAAGKAIGVSAALALVLTPAALMGSAALAIASGPAAATVDHAVHFITRIVGLAVVYGLYFAVFIAVALAVSAIAKRSSHALALLVAFWVMNAVIVPRGVSDLSRRMYPTPTAFEFGRRVQHDMYDGLAVHDYNVKRAADLRDRLLREYKVTRIEDLPVNFRGVDYLEREAHSNDTWDAHYRALWTSFDRQTAVHHAAGWAAPLIAVRSLSMSLSGADIFHHRHFAAEAEAYRRRLVFAMNDNLAHGAGSQKRGAYAAEASLWSTVEPFAYRQPELAWTLSHVRTSAAALAVWTLCACAALVFAVRRLRVE
jgi:ABC-2 type transport system permease protein